ncbi:MAG: DUF2203 domain-containing protein [Tumebacillaceae bacterium]
MPKRYFTVWEANALIPQLEVMLYKLQDMKRDVHAKYTRLEATKSALPSNITPDFFFQEEAELEFAVFSANAMLRQILDIGVEVKDIDTGLCDFYALLNGSEVFLCWRLGESEITHWHGIYEGYLGRKPIIDEVDFDLD